MLVYQISCSSMEPRRPAVTAIPVIRNRCPGCGGERLLPFPVFLLFHGRCSSLFQPRVKDGSCITRRDGFSLGFNTLRKPESPDPVSFQGSDDLPVFWPALPGRSRRERIPSSSVHRMGLEQVFSPVSGQTRTERAEQAPGTGSSGTDRVKAAIRQDNGRFSGFRNYGILPPVSSQETQRSGIMEKIPRKFLAMHGLLCPCTV